MSVSAELRDLDSPFAVDVRDGLLRAPKRLRCTWFYDEIGSQLFEQICELPEYYLTRAEREILALKARALAGRLDPSTVMVELGSGSSVKTRILIDAFLDRHRRLSYLPIDVSTTMLLESCQALVADRPTLEVQPIADEYQPGLERAFAIERSRPKLVLWLGSSIGNFHPVEAATFLRQLRERMSARDRLLVGIDLRKDRRTLERAYDDGQGVTARFNLNLLERINRELGGRFDLDRFRHLARWDERSGCVTMHLVALGAQRVRIERLGLEVPFSDGETIHTECSFKYSPEEIDALARDSGFAVETRWLDGARRFSVNLLVPASH